VNLDSIVQQLQQQQVSGGTTAKAVTAKTATASGSGAGDTGDATITANDFLTLLVTELQHQDPTSDADPNAYVNQLINVNSLQQLISINTGIGTLDSSVTSPTSTSGATGASGTSGTSGSAVAGVNGTSSSTSVTPGQVASARASYAAFDSAPLSAPDSMTAQLSVSAQLDPSNPLMASPDSSTNPAVPAMWRSTQGVTS
jgi:flagellar basal-body rod modification protein FlgD